MDSMTLFIASLAVSCIGALASVLLIKADNAAKTAGCLIGAVAAVLSFIAGLEAVLGDVSSLNTVFFFPFARLELLLNGLAGLIAVAQAAIRAAERRKVLEDALAAVDGARLDDPRYLPSTRFYTYGLTCAKRSIRALMKDNPE